MYDDVTALSWGPWRAEFVEPVEGGHRVHIRTHSTRTKRGETVGNVVVADPTAEGLREALQSLATAQGVELPTPAAPEVEVKKAATPRKKKRTR